MRRLVLILLVCLLALPAAALAAARAAGDGTLVVKNASVTKIQAGYTRYFQAFRQFRAGIGAEGSIGLVPRDLESAYGSRTIVGGG